MNVIDGGGVHHILMFPKTFNVLKITLYEEQVSYFYLTTLFVYIDEKVAGLRVKQTWNIDISALIRPIYLHNSVC